MTSYPDTVVDHRSSGKPPAKSNFSQTCTLFSHFLNEKRSSAASTLGLVGKKIDPQANTKDLISNLQNSDVALRLKASALDFLPQLVENSFIKKSNDRSPGFETPQLTILYAGKMLVFDAFPPEKATEIMELATKLASDDKLKGSILPQTNIDSENSRPGNQSAGPDMRYPRRASLVKFLEKRKERVMSKGPYQINNPNPTRHEGNSSEYELEDQCSKQLDLNL